MTHNTAAIALLLAALSPLSAAAQPTPSAAASPQPKSFDDAVRQTRPNTMRERPRPASQVAVLDLILDADAGQLRAARLERMQVVSANAPKAFARSRGSWEVRLLGPGQPVSYRIPNPLEDIEVENPSDSPTPFSQVRPAGPVPVQLIVPLARDGRPLDVRRIEIVDTASGRTVVEAPVRR
ncbi:MAG TPA: hypothetical protein PK177_19685 [Burkholderiaceae bacterium]|nr:hypothetical protein [Burkholderiaceae bacterium]